MRWVGDIRWGTAWVATLRVAGLGIIIHEALSSHPGERPMLYLVAAAMMGLSITLPVDRKRQKDGDE